MAQLWAQPQSIFVDSCIFEGGHCLRWNWERINDVLQLWRQQGFVDLQSERGIRTCQNLLSVIDGTCVGNRGVAASP